MPQYKYTAISKNGVRVTGVTNAFNELDAMDRVKQECPILVSLRPVDEEKMGILNMEIGGNKLNAKAFSIMCSQFSIILSAGLPVARTCALIADKTSDKKLKKMLHQVSDDVESGRTVAASFAERGGNFLPVTFVETIRAGEESGNLDRAFESMYQHYDKQLKMARKVKSALSYPLFVVAIAVVVVIVMMIKVIPTFVKVFEDYDSDLPFLTKALINTSLFFQNHIILMLLVIVALILGVKLYGNTEEGRLRFAKLQLGLPVLGEIAMLNAASQLANTMATMLGAGLSITRSITITARVLDNYYLSQELGKLTGLIEEGRNLGECFKAVEGFPDILKDMVGVGEETGELESTLHTIAGFYDAELEMAIDSAMKKLEPTLLCFIAVIAGFVVFALYGSMFSMYDLF